MAAYYNEHDKYAAAWLRNLITAGHIAPGEVDERSIEDVRPDDLRGFTQCHFFAGVSVWSYALRRVRWPDDRRIWTGSCPCQPFSEAGKGHGFADERHLWPAFFHLITHVRPERVVGEQVAGRDGLAWLDLVQTDLEAADYAPGAVPFPAAGVGAPERRERLYWLADANDSERWSDGARRNHRHGQDARWAQGSGDAQGRGAPGELGDAVGRRFEKPGLHAVEELRENEPLPPPGGKNGGRARPNPAGLLQEGPLGLAAGQGPQGEPHGRWAVSGEERAALERTGGQSLRLAAEPHGPGPVNGFWRNADWVLCRDPDGPKWRPVEPGAFPLAHESPSRVGRLRAYGNALVAEAAVAFLRAVGD